MDDFKITDVKGYHTDDVGKPYVGYDMDGNVFLAPRTQIWLDTDFTLDGYPVTASVNPYYDVYGDPLMAVAEFYVNTDFYKTGFKVDSLDKYRVGKGFKAWDDYKEANKSSGEFLDKNGNKYILEDFKDRVKKYVFDNKDFPYVMLYDEYKDYRNAQEYREQSKYKYVMPDDEYMKYLDVVHDELESGREYIGSITNIDDLRIAYESDPVFRESYEEWLYEQEHEQVFPSIANQFDSEEDYRKYEEQSNCNEKELSKIEQVGLTFDNIEDTSESLDNELDVLLIE